MKNQFDRIKELDPAIRASLADIVAVAPTKDQEPTRDAAIVGAIVGAQATRRSFALVAAAAVVLVGVGSVMVTTSRGGEISPASSPQNTLASPANVSPTGPLLSTALPVDAVPYIVFGDGWELTDVYSNIGPLLTGGFEGATVFVGDGPLYDAPAFAAAVIDTTQTGTSMSALLDEGEPVEVAGVTGSVYIDRAGTSDPFVTMYWPIDDSRYALFSATGLTVDEAVIFANGLTLDGDRLVGNPPDGYRSLPTLPTTGSRRHINYRFSDGYREIDINGENRGIAHLLSAGVIADQTTTRTVNGVEVAVRVDEEGTTASRIFWMSGDWSFYVIADGFTDGDELLHIIGELTLIDSETFVAAARELLDIVMPGEHSDLALPVVEGLGLTDMALTDAITTDLPMSMYHYGFELVMGAACVFEDRRSAIAPDDSATPAELATQIRAIADAAIAAGHARAVELILTPLLDIVERRNPEVELSDWTDCPTWATTN
jgi:hypothetical protein